MLFLAWRQMMSRKKQTLLILMGISFGTLLFVSISGVQLGMRDYIASALLNNTAHVLISGADNNIDKDDVTSRIFSDEHFVRWIAPPMGKRDDSVLSNYPGWHKRLSEDPRVHDFAPRLAISAILSNGKFSQPVSLIGTVPERQIRISAINDYMKQGRFADLKGGAPKIVIGSGAAKNLGITLGQTLNINTHHGIAYPFRVVGISHFGDDNADKTLSFAELSHVQTLNRTPGRISQIAVALLDINQSAQVAQSWKILSRDKVEDWQEANARFMEMIRMQDFVRYFITTAVLIVAAFGIYNVLSIMISQKKREIAILRSIGYTPAKILELIMIQGVFLGLSGGTLGMLLGYFMCLWIESIDFGFELGGSNHLLVSYDASIYITAFVSSIIAALGASILPARSASKMTPMDIIRSAS